VSKSERSQNDLVVGDDKHRFFNRESLERAACQGGKPGGRGYGKAPAGSLSRGRIRISATSAKWDGKVSVKNASQNPKEKQGEGKKGKCKG